MNLMRHLRSGGPGKTELGLFHCLHRGHGEFAIKSETACQKQVPYQTTCQANDGVCKMKNNQNI